MPFTVLDYENLNNTGEFYERPDLVGNPFAGTSSPTNFLNLSAFAAPCNWSAAVAGCDTANPNFHFGSSPRNKFYGPHYRNFDFSLTKDTKLSERVNMQLRADFFNIFNHPNFNLPNLGSGGGSSGAGFSNVTGGAAITQTLPDAQREIQFGLKLQF